MRSAERITQDAIRLLLILIGLELSARLFGLPSTLIGMCITLLVLFYGRWLR